MRRNAPLTLIDAISLTAIASLFLCFCMPVLRASQEQARSINTINNLKMIGLALHNYHSAFDCFPMSEVDARPEDVSSRGRGHSGFTLLLPFLEQTGVYNAYNFWVEPWSNMNATATRTRVNVYLSDVDEKPSPTPADKIRKIDGDGLPGSNTFGPLRFGMNWGGDRGGWSREFGNRYPNYSGVMFKVHSLGADGKAVHNTSIRDIRDGSAYTIAVGEKRDAYGWALGGWGSGEFEPGDSPIYSGDDPVARRAYCGSFNEAGPAFGFVDGSVKRIKPPVARELWHALLSRDGGETLKNVEF